MRHLVHELSAGNTWVWALVSGVVAMSIVAVGGAILSLLAGEPTIMTYSEFQRIW